MIDLRCHMLPSIDDGARDLSTALQMAELAVADGITQTACTPHIYPGVFDNTHAGIRDAVDNFRGELLAANIPLEITYGADIQVVPDLVKGLAEGRLPTLNGSRYFLFEPPHHVALPRLDDLLHGALVAGYVPVITHPERLSYIDSDYDKFLAAAERGAWIQLTGGSLLGRFGPRVKKIAERFIRDGVTHLIASDGHNLKNRTPVLAEARDAAAAIVGEEEALLMMQGRPAAVLANSDPSQLTQPPALIAGGSPVSQAQQGRKGWLSRLFSRTN